MSAVSSSHLLSFLPVTNSLTHNSVSTQKEDTDTIDDKIGIILNAIRGEIEAVQLSGKKFKEIAVSYNTSCFGKDKKKCTIISLIGMTTLGMIGTSIASALLYISDQSNTNLALLITSISGTILEGVSAFAWDMYSKYKDEHDDAKANLEAQQQHMVHLTGLLISLTQFLNNKKMDKIETFKKCLEHLRALPATINRKIDEATREELISSMIEFLHADHPLVAQINEVCRMAEALKNIPEDSKESPKDKKQVQIKPESKESPVVSVTSRPVIWHSSEEDLTSEEIVRKPVGADHDSQDSPRSLVLMQRNKSDSKEFLFANAYKSLLDTLNIGHLRYFRFKGLKIDSPIKELDFNIAIASNNGSKTPKKDTLSPKRWGIF